jgi:hypothetical protein
MTFLCRLLFWSFFGGVLATGAQAQETEQGHGVFCDTQAQVEQFAAYYEGHSIAEALEQINLTSPSACGALRAAFIRGDEVKSIRIKQGTARLYRVLVVGIWRGQWARIEPAVQYIAVLDREEEA